MDNKRHHQFCTEDGTIIANILTNDLLLGNGDLIKLDEKYYQIKQKELNISEMSWKFTVKMM